MTLLKAVARFFNDAEDTIKEEYYLNRQATASLVGQISRRSDVHIDALTEIEQTLDKPDWTNDQKISFIRQVLDRKRLKNGQLLTDKQRIAELKTINQPIDERTDYYQALEKASFRLQLRVSAIVQVLHSIRKVHIPICCKPFYTTNSSRVNYSQHQRCHWTFWIRPSGNMCLPQTVNSGRSAAAVSLYKALLFGAVRDGLRDGTLTVLSSYEYRSVDEYQIPRAQWKTHREEYLRRAGLLDLSNPASTLVALNDRLNHQFEWTNGRLADNTQVFYDAHGGWHLHRYRADEREPQQATRQLYPASQVISLREVLLQIENLTGFLSKFQHRGFPQKPTRPDFRLLLAAIIGYGENIGIRKMALISKDISIHTLETVATQYFSPEMVLEANDCIVSHSNALPLTDLFRRKEGFIMTGSDGQKYDISVPSLRASASYKYFGNGEGVCIYSGLDEAG